MRRVAEELGAVMHRPVTFEGHESPTALISNGQLGHRLFGYPRVSIEHVIRWIANWVIHGGATLGKPTHFETRDGKF